jgi:GcrA cell cycle regulator
MTTVLFWTPEKEKILRKMWAAGNSAREVSVVIGTTRNAVLGKVHRLKLPTPRTAKTQNVPKPKPKPKPKPEPKPTISAEEAEKIYAVVREAVMGLGKGECRWPYGAPHENKIAFCKEPVFETYSYCLKHCYHAYSNFEEAQEKKKGKRPK